MIAVEIEATLTIDGIGSVGVGVSCGAVGTLGPAGADGVGATGGIALEVFGVRQCLRSTGGSNATLDTPFRIANRSVTEATHIIVIGGAGIQTRNRCCIGADDGCRTTDAVGIDRSCGNHDLIATGSTVPAERKLVVVDIRNCNIGGTCAIGDFGADIKHDIRTISTTGRGRHSRGCTATITVAGVVTSARMIAEVGTGGVQGVGIACKSDEQVVAAAVDEGRAEGDFQPITGGGGEVAAVDEGHCGAVDSIAGGGELVYGNLLDVDSSLLNGTRIGASEQLDTIDAVVGLDAHVGKFLSGIDSTGIALEVGAIGVESVGVARRSSMSNGVNNIDGVFAAVGSGLLCHDIAP